MASDHQYQDTSLSNGTLSQRDADPGENREATMTLHQACEEGNIENVKKMLTALGSQNQKENLADCLQVAVENGKRDVAKEIIKHKMWKDSLRSPTMQIGITPFQNLMKKMPDVARLVLDKCVRKCKDNSKKVTIDFEFLEESPADAAPDNVEEEVNEKKSHVLECLDEELLVHPVVTSLLRWKWIHYIGWFYLINLCIYLIFLSFLTAFALTVPNPQLPVCTEGGNQTNASTSTSCDLSPGRRSFLITAAMITIVFSLLRLLLELGQLLNMKQIKKFLTNKPREVSIEEAERGENSKLTQMGEVGREKLTQIREGGRGKLRQIYTHCINWDYFRRISNYLEVPLFILSFAFVGVLHHKCLCPHRGQWQAGIIAVFFAWMDLLLFLNKWPNLGVYIGMLQKIIIKFLAVAIIAILLLLAFGFAFYMAFYEPDLPDTPFMNPAVAFVEVISYAIGGPDNSIFRLSNDDTAVETIPYPVLSYVIWIVFGIIVSVLFLNFLVGLAVDDVQELRKQADCHRMKLMIQLFRQVEEILNWSWVKYFIDKCPKLKILRRPVNKQWSIDIEHDRYWYKIAFLWGDEIENIIAELQRRQKQQVQLWGDEIENIIAELQRRQKQQELFDEPIEAGDDITAKH